MDMILTPRDFKALNTAIETMKKALKEQEKTNKEFRKELGEIFLDDKKTLNKLILNEKLCVGRKKVKNLHNSLYTFKILKRKVNSEWDRKNNK